MCYAAPQPVRQCRQWGGQAGGAYLQHEDGRAVQLLGDAAVVLVDGEHGRLVVLVDHAHLHRGGVLPLAVRRHHVQLVPAQRPRGAPMALLERFTRSGVQRKYASQMCFLYFIHIVWNHFGPASFR